MDKRLVLGIVFTLVTLVSVQSAEAIIDSQHLTSPEYMRSRNYSPYTIELINGLKVDPYSPIEEAPEPTTLTEKVKSTIVKCWKELDPAVYNDNFGHSKIKADSTGFSDI